MEGLCIVYCYHVVIIFVINLVIQKKKKKKSKVSDYSSIHIVLTNCKYTKSLFLDTSIYIHLPTKTKNK